MKGILTFRPIQSPMNIARPAQTGDLVASTYRLEHVLGQGRSGIVFAARDRRSADRVAIKFLRRDLAYDRAAVEAFRNHARVAAAIRSNEVCRAFELTESESGVPCVVMEHLEGCDLSRDCAERVRYDVAEAASLIVQACAGLAAALQAGVVHADLKPSKLFVLAATRGTTRLKLLDLGGSICASQPRAATRQLSGSQAALWQRSAEYAAPEQLDVEGLVDARTNVWALGAILYLLLCGRPPFDESTPQRLVAAIRSSDPPAPRTLGVDIPEGLAQILSCALSKSRAERFASVTQLGQALAPYAVPRGPVAGY
jgi:serine/threonine protein kinase